MSTPPDEETMPLTQAPIDNVLDHYYRADETMDRVKLCNIIKVMKSAMSITKSKTGEVILKTNRFERARLKTTNKVIQRERTMAEVENNKNKILFKAQYKKWMDYNDSHLPQDIQSIKDKYRSVKKTIKQRKQAKKITSEPKWGTIPFSKLYNLNDRIEDEKNNFKKIATSGSHPNNEQNDYPFSYPRRQIASRENLSSQSRRRVNLWRENTFDMSSIRELLVDQKLKQESIYCKKKVDKWREQMRERQKTIAENFTFTRTSTFIREPVGSASTITDSDSRPVTRTFLPHIDTASSPETKSPRLTRSRMSEHDHKDTSGLKKKGDRRQQTQSLFLKDRTVSFNT